ncbi:CobW/HypB/UreG, nucleotide-binding domain containing protein [Cladophialophora carrionii]|uniref:CobW/HypB/UreG, nucleotide-binding domain containing protein n=1 Tax=Cladophialophora carrionii TaxID=86049 RepID=A0A1C1CBP0_9EURO|nr:CobW/HypB/UreG, nucleotide-binding domain containing protein [Cladophialophora carrionii]
MAPIPVTIITGFLGAGKTTLILNLIPQLPKNYKLALLKNEFGDVAVDSQLAGSASISGVRELLNGCICCNLVGQLSDALFQLKDSVDPSRIIIETSGSAFPATLAMEVNRVSRENPGSFTLDGVISVIDVENWKGYDDTSYTAKMQAKFTDLIVFNKWELVDERKFEDALDRVGDLDVQVAWVKSQRGWVDVEIVMGIDGAMVRDEGLRGAIEFNEENTHDHTDGHGHGHGDTHAHTNHQDEVEVLSVVLTNEDPSKPPQGVVLESFEDLLLSAPKDEVYRIKGLVLSSKPPPDSTGDRKPSIAVDSEGQSLYVLNWAFGRWTYTPLPSRAFKAMENASARLTFILARGEASRWIRRLEKGDFIALEGQDGKEEKGSLKIEKIG